MRLGWQTKKLGELCRIDLGSTPSRGDSSLWDTARETDNVWLSIADLLGSRDNVVSDSKEYVSNKGAKSCKLVREGTLLVSFKLTLGRLAFAGRDLFTNEAIAALSVLRPGEITKEYLFYFLQYFDWKKAAQNDVKLKGLTLNKAKLQAFDIHYPVSLTEQRRIVALLEEALAKFARAQVNAEQNEWNAREIFTRALQDAFDPTTRAGSWDDIQLEEACIVEYGTRVTRKRDGGRGYTVYGGGGPTFEVDAPNRIDRLVVARFGMSPECTRFVQGEFFLNDSGLTVSPRDESRLFQGFLDYQLLARNAEIYLLGKGTAQKNLDVPAFRQLVLYVPRSLEEQQEVVARLEELRARSEELAALYAKKSQSIEALRRSFMHQVFAEAL